MNPKIQELKDFGFIFDDAVAFVGDAAPEMVTAPNAGIPAELTAYISPTVITVLTAKQGATELFDEVKEGDWTTSHARFLVREPVGRTSPYSDRANNGKANVNYNFLTREQYVFQTTIEYGDYETAISSRARINYVADQQDGAARVMSIDTNKFYLLGVANREVYGLLNDPNLPSAITAAPTGASSSTLWANKTTAQIYKDITDLFKELTVNSGGLITQASNLVLAVPPALSVELNKATDFNVSVLNMLERAFRSLTIVTIPELANESGNKIFMFARSVAGMPTAELGYSEKMRAGRVVAHESSFSQKFTGTTYGCVVYLPYAISSMTGA